MRQEEQKEVNRRSPSGGAYGGNDVGGVGGWGETEDSGSPLDEDVDEGGHEDADGRVPLQQQNSCVRVGVRSRAEHGGVAPDLFPDSLKVVH